MRSTCAAPRAWNDGEDVPHQRFGKAEPAGTRVDGKIPEERAGPAQRDGGEPPGRVMDQEEQFRVELGIAGDARPPFLERAVGAVVEDARQQRMDIGRVGRLERAQRKARPARPALCSAPSSTRRSLTSLGPRGFFAVAAGSPASRHVPDGASCLSRHSS